MLVKKYLLGAEWLNNIMIILLFVVSGEFFACLFGGTLGTGFIALTSLIITGSYFARVYISKLPLFLLFHMIMYAIFVFLPIMFGLKLAAFVVLIIISVCNFFFWTGSDVRSYTVIHPVLSLIFAAVFIYASVKGASYLLDVAYVCGICFLSLFFLRTYLLNGARFASGMLINKNTPINEMFKNNSRLVFPLVGAFCAGMFLLKSAALANGLSTAVRFLMNCIGRVIFYILSLFSHEEERVQIVVREQGELELPVTVPFPTWLITLIAAIEKVTAVFIICIFVYYMIKMTIRFLMIYFNKHGYEIMTVTAEDHTEIREHIRHERSKGIGRLLAGGSERERIRRRYRTSVMRLCRRGFVLRRDHTPGERLWNVAESCDKRISDDFAELTGRYEEARYNR